MKKRNTRLYLLLGLLLATQAVGAQCPVGTTQAELNWDHIDFLPSNNNRYTDFYPSSAFPYTQKFAIGTRSVSFAMAPQASITLNGENGTNTAHGGSPFVTAGDDVQFTTTVTTATTITMTFDQEVQNVRFSIFDVDNSQRVRLDATNAASTALPVLLTLANVTSGITLGGTALSPTATAPATAYGNNDTRGSINIVIAGPVKQIVITLDNSSGNIWLSDIVACVNGSFPTGYHQVSRPFTGQPQYVLAVVNNNIYYVNPTNGQAYFLFNEPAHNRLNSLAYDPYKRMVYYTFSLSGGNLPQSDKTVRRYSVDTKTISILIPDVNTFGIPTYETGVESGAASFYNGSLYLGIEGYTGADYAASRKSTIWKIDFDAAGNPIAPATQVFGILSDDGTNSQNIHDWSDFGISNGKIIDFDGSGSGDIDYYHFDLMTGVRTNYKPVGHVPRQTSIGWDEAMYNVDATIAAYNGTTGVGTAYTISSPLGPVIPTGSSASWGDAAGPYRPFLDFGDAPASYDPDPLSPACHDTLTPNVSGQRTRMMLGPAEDVEWLKRGFTTVEDNYEDGLSFVPIFSPITGSYVVRVDVMNNSGTNATVIGWLDYNGNGLFDASEASTIMTVPSAAGMQQVNLSWSGLPNLLPDGSFTYLRIRITQASAGMGAANATGYYSMGEVEDYRIVVENFVLPIQLISFDVNLQNGDKARLQWQAVEEASLKNYEIERSRDGSTWSTVATVPASGQSGTFNYQWVDNNLPAGKTWYRLRLVEVNASSKFSEIKWVQRKTDYTLLVQLSPNPASTYLNYQLQGIRAGSVAKVQVINVSGQVLETRTLPVATGLVSGQIPLSVNWPSGSYWLQVLADDKVIHQPFVIRR